MGRYFGMVTTAASTEYTVEALKSFFQHTTLSEEDRFVLIDNDAQDGTADLISEYNIELITNKKPRGFADNINQVMKKAEAEQADLFFLNNDIIFTPGWIGPMMIDTEAIIIPSSNQQLQYGLPGWQLRGTMTLDDYRGHEEHLLQIVKAHREKQKGFRKVFVLPFFCVKIPYSVYSVVGKLDKAFGKGGGEDFDYCLRSHLKGFPVLVAAPSFILHFMGRSTWMGPETEEETKGRNEKKKEIFSGKWGKMLTSLLIDGSQEMLESRSDLTDFMNKAYYRNVIMSLVEGKIEKEMGSHYWQPRIAAVYCVYDDFRWILSSLESTYAACEKIYFLIGNKPWNGKAGDNKDTLDVINAFPDPDKKISIVHDDWVTETEQRNAGLEMLEKEGFDYCLVVDADEIYDSFQLSSMIDHVAHTRCRAAWQLSWYTYWKSCHFRIDPMETFRPIALVKVGEARFRDKREVDTTDIEGISKEICVCHHMSYARTDDEIQRKISTFSYANEIVPDWYENIWKAWDEDPTIEDLHPCWPHGFRRTALVSKDDLPEVLQSIYEEEPPQASSMINLVKRLEEKREPIPKQKVILVTTMGMAGTSNVMGLLNILGAYVGRKDRLIPAGPQNPRGIFELRSHREFVLKAFSGHIQGVPEPPGIEWLKGRCDVFAQQYFGLIRTEFRNAPCIALQIPWYLPLAFWYEARKHFDIKVIELGRPVQKQAQMMLNQWRQLKIQQLANLNQEQVVGWNMKWSLFGKRVLEAYPLPCLHLNYDRLVANPSRYISALADFAELPVTDWDTVLKWINPNLAKP